MSFQPFTHFQALTVHTQTERKKGTHPFFPKLCPILQLHPLISLEINRLTPSFLYLGPFHFCFLGPMDPPPPPRATSDPAAGAAAISADPAPLLTTAHNHPSYNEVRLLFICSSA